MNAIPHGRGLGSSAAAVVSGMLAARALVADGADRLPDADVLALAVDLEGHPDNVAACLAGGLTVAWRPAGPVPGAPSMAIRAPALTWSVAGGAARRAPAAARRCSPSITRRGLRGAHRAGDPRGAAGAARSSVPHADAAANAARSALLVAALTSDPAVLFDATEDFLHQRYRAPVMPQTADLLGQAAPGRGRGGRVRGRAQRPGPDLADSQPGPEVVDSIASGNGYLLACNPPRRRPAGRYHPARPGGAVFQARGKDDP